MTKLTELDAQIAAVKKHAADKVRQLKADHQRIEARELSQLLKGSRAADTRRKILAGAMVLSTVEKDEALEKWFNGQMVDYLKRPTDRALFDLEPLPETETTQTTVTTTAPPPQNPP